ncbi:class I SAM-dependent methyltransferase [Fangia hongkongensis]|uniref:class I SAM-dependent methyltransferase n=1 Tax=Fangia hongkongensis TaxID=270495 RepID=UPI00036CE643|nr:class I SAM-dependent methyltransferase [Fangia hongkongensis]MBK2126273.1 class I SAM-dependent methyltransferase [Fangia hongkongensis]
MVLSDQDYAGIYKIIDNNRNHERVVRYIKDNVLSDLSNNTAYLDIGAGDGKITCQIAPYFKEIMAIEPNPVFFEGLRGTKDAKCIEADFLQVTLTGKYDFILCSHVLYHVDPKDWTRFVDKAYAHLNTNGKMLFILGGDRGDNFEQYKKHNDNYASSAILREILTQKGMAFSEEIIEDSYQTDSFRDMLSLSKFCILENCFNQYAEKTIDSFGVEKAEALCLEYAKSKKINDGLYVMKRAPAYVTITKSQGL